MEIHCLGLNHKTAPLDLLERAYFSDDQLRAALARCGCGDGVVAGPLELVILSTCNRVELYALLEEPDRSQLEQLLVESAGLTSEDLGPHLYHHQGLTAVHHLLRVASGLDSMVVGEPQILGQVGEAYKSSLEANASGAVLNKVFHAALHTGKRARAESAIATNPSTTSSVAVAFAADIVPDLSSAKVLVLGAGEMAELAVRALTKRGTNAITVINRTVGRAQELAGRWAAEAKAFEQLLPALAHSDILISSTGAPHTVLHRPTVQKAMDRRPERPLVILDIAVPRDIDPAVAEIANVHRFDLDALQSHLDNSLEQRQGEVPKVESILEEELAAFESWYASIGIRPLIADLHRLAEDIRVREVERTLAQLQSLAPDEKEKIEAMSRAVVKRLLHTPTLRLKERERNSSSAAYALITRDLFALSKDEQTEADRMRGDQPDGDTP